MGGPLIFGAVVAALAALPPFDPLIDAPREPPRGYTLGAGLEQQGDAFGFFLEARSPWMLDGFFALSVAGGIGWFPEVVVLDRDGERAVEPWSPFGHARLRAEAATRLAESPHRLFLAMGPSLLFPSSEVSTARAGIGIHGGLGLELFAGDRFRTLPFAIVVELGAAANLAEADARVGEAENAASLATGFAISVSLRWYAFEEVRPTDSPEEPVAAPPGLSKGPLDMSKGV